MLPHGDAGFDPRILNDGVDRKLYVAGVSCRGLLKPWPRDAAAPGLPFTPDADFVALAHRVAIALQIDILGVDVVLGAAGPVIVAVNLFPSFKGIPDAAALNGARLQPITAHCG